MKFVQRSLRVWVLLISMLLAACVAPPNVAPTEVPPSPTPLPMPSAMGTLEESAATASNAVEIPATGTDLSGASLYQISCAACHAQDRAGNDFDQDGQKVSVPALAWDDLHSMYETDPSRGSVEDQLAIAITKGQNEDGEDMNAMMPRWSSLSESQIDSLIQFLQTEETTTDVALPPEATQLTGEQLYATACAACHGVNGEGKTFEVDGNTIETPALSWGELSDMYSANPSRGSVEDQLAIAITKGQNEDGEDMGSMMPHWSFLSQAQVDSLIQYIQEAFK